MLPDLEGLLQGQGSQVRQVVFRENRDIRVRALQGLLRTAFSLPEQKELKLELIRTRHQWIQANKSVGLRD